ncbi:MAG: CcmD family protein [Kouleothrix sp.]|nr:CcmD family protein [Kouleothrix sp.]
MSNFLLDPGVAIYATMAVALVVWLGIFAFLWRIDRQARELRRKLDAELRPEASAPRATLEPRSRPPQARVAANDE